MTQPALDARELRRRWDAACDRADAELRRTRQSPLLQDEPTLVAWCTGELGAVARVQAAVDGKRWRPGTRPPELMREFPSTFDAPEFRPMRDALEELDRLFRNGLDVDWDWTSGFPPGWPTSMKDRLRSYFPWRDS